MLHSHIFKNAGTTLLSALEKQFHNDAITIESDETTFLATNTIIEAVITHPKLKLISSHKLSLIPPDDDRFCFIPLVLVRNPLDRLGSMYAFYKSQKTIISHECALAKALSIHDFVDVLMQAELDSSFNNLQCRFFLGQSSQLSEDNWPRVENQLNRLNCLGLIEKYDESMVVWENFLDRYFPGIDLSYTMKNVSFNRDSSLHERLNTIANNIGSDLLKEFYKRNKFDFRLYEKSKLLLKEHVNSVKRFDSKFHNFTARLDISNKIHLHKPTAKDKTNENSSNTNKNTIKISLDCQLIDLPKLKDNYALSKSNKLKIVACQLVDSITLQPKFLVEQSQLVKLLIVVKAYKNINNPLVGFSVENSKHQMLFGMNNYYSHKEAKAPTIGTEQIYCFTFNMPPLNHGSYSISPAFASGTQKSHKVLSLFRDTSVFCIGRLVEPQLPGILYINDYEFTNY